MHRLIRICLVCVAASAGSAHGAPALGWRVVREFRSFVPSSIACPSPRSCIAAGSVLTHPSAGVAYGAVSTWSGLRWGSPAGLARVQSSLDSIACHGSFCMAVGGFSRPAGHGALSVRLAGGSWQRVRVPGQWISLRFELSGLLDVSCPAASRCTAVGSSREIPIVARFAGRRWLRTQVSLPRAIISSPAYRGAGLYGISCPTRGGCVAIGAYQIFGPPNQEVISHLFTAVTRGHGWAIHPTGIAARQLIAGISCARFDACTVVGALNIQNPWHFSRPYPTPYALRWNGTTWTPQSAPVPGGSGGELTAVSCPTVTSCTAVGFSATAAHDSARPLIERWNGTTWTIQPSPRPRLPAPSLNDVACTSPRTCTATGTDDGPAGYIEQEL